jgi:biotin-dependent carboxylase-like uncharacterized protein
MSSARIHVEAPGFLTTVQDLGRFGYARFGVSASGAADAVALRAGNLLVGNDENAAALEMTLTGGAFSFDCPCVAAVTGAAMDGIAMWTAFETSSLRLGLMRDGARAYLCIRGGIDVPLVLGSASTHLMSGLGGFEGRALRRGDVLPTGGRAVRKPSRRPFGWRAPNGPLRATPGPQASWFDDTFYRSEYNVREESNRMGLRLQGPVFEVLRAGQLVTEGVPLGAIQSPHAAEPIINFVEHQTTGGYPKIANVISADLWRVGQLRPKDAVRFERITIERALLLLQEQERHLYELLK